MESFGKFWKVLESFGKLWKGSQRYVISVGERWMTFRWGAGELERGVGRELERDRAEGGKGVRKRGREGWGRGAGKE